MTHAVAIALLIVVAVVGVSLKAFVESHRD
jgi:hypothetical protein